MRIEKFICNICGAPAYFQAHRTPRSVGLVAPAAFSLKFDHLCKNAACLHSYVDAWHGTAIKAAAPKGEVRLA